MTGSTVHVDLWVDFVCPFSYLATSRIEAARSQVAFPVAVEFHSFQLMPDLPEEYSASNAEFFRDYRGIPPEELTQRSRPLIRMTAEAGLPYSLPDIRQASTRKAHQLLRHATAHGLQAEAVATVFRTHFADGRDIGRLEVLLDIAGQLGLDPSDAERALLAEEHLEAVEADIDRARQLGIRSVPFFVVQDTLALSGAQEVPALVNLLEQAHRQAASREPGRAT